MIQLNSLTFLLAYTFLVRYLVMRYAVCIDPPVKNGKLVYEPRSKELQG